MLHPLPCRIYNNDPFQVALKNWHSVSLRDVRQSWELRKYRISQSEILFGTVVSVLQSTSKIGKVTSPARRGNLIGNFVFFFYFLIVFAGYMWIIKSSSGKVLTVRGFLCTKMYWHPFVLSNSSGHKPLGKTEIPNY